MLNLGVNFNYMLEMSLADLHSQTRDWMSEIDYWLAELSFFRKILKTNSQLALEKGLEEEMINYVDLMDYYQVRMLKELKQKIHNHDDSLKSLLNGQERQDEESFREIHKSVGNHIHIFETEFRNLKKEFYYFIETIID